jgi:predicted DNA-binding transcriptional regulator AlpA
VDRCRASPSSSIQTAKCVAFARGSLWGLDMQSYSIDEFCGLHRFSRSFFYKIAKDGKGPATFKIGCSTRISEQANTEWVAKLEAEAAVA